MAKTGMADPYKHLRRASRWKRSDVEQVLAAWEASGESLSAFARARRLKLHRLQWWRTRLAEQSQAPQVHLVPVVPEQAPLIPVGGPSSCSSSVCLDIGIARIEIGDLQHTDPRWLAALAKEMLRGGQS